MSPDSNPFLTGLGLRLGLKGPGLGFEGSGLGHGLQLGSSISTSEETCSCFSGHGLVLNDCGLGLKNSGLGFGLGYHRILSLIHI